MGLNAIQSMRRAGPGLDACIQGVGRRIDFFAGLPLQEREQIARPVEADPARKRQAIDAIQIEQPVRDTGHHAVGHRIALTAPGFLRLDSAADRLDAIPPGFVSGNGPGGTAIDQHCQAERQFQSTPPPEGNEAIKNIIDIFGIEPSMTGVILGSAGSPSILASISYAINGAALMAATVLIIWTGTTAIMNMAHEGEEVMGKGYNSMWVPLRSALAIAFLVPMVSGYSLIQVFVMVTAATGFKAADFAWSKAIDHLDRKGGLVSVAPPYTDQLGIALFKSNMCMIKTNDMHSLERGTAGGPLIALPPYETGLEEYRTGGGRSKNTAQRFYIRFSYDGKKKERLGKSVCGAYAIEHPFTGTGYERAVAATMHHGTGLGLRQLRQDVNQIALKFLKGRNPDRPDERKVINQQQTANLLNEAIGLYNARVQGYASGAIKAGMDPAGRANEKFFQEARENGWMMAGSWFWTIAAMNRRIAEIIKAQPAFSLPDTSRMVDDWQFELNILEKEINRHVVRKMQITTAGTAGRLGADGDLWSAFKQGSNDAMADLMQGVNTLLNEDGEPEVKIQSLGHTLIGGVELMLVAAFVGDRVAAAAGKIEEAATSLLKGKGNSGRGGFISSTADWLVWMIILLAVPIFICGVLLAFWFPAVPFINWMAAIMGWLIMLVEAVVAAPFWAAAHAVGRGDGIAGRHGAPGYMLILSLIARPVLMVAGLFGAFLVMHYGCKFLLYSFVPFMAGMNAGSLSGVVTFIAMCILLVTLCLIVANRSWSLIYVIPDKVLAWVGGHAPQLGERETEGQSKQMFVAGISKTTEAGPGAVNKLQKKAEDKKRQGNDQAEGGEEGGTSRNQGGHDHQTKREDQKHLPGQKQTPEDQ